VSFGFSQSNTLIQTGAVTNLNYIKMGASALFNVQITLLTDKSVLVSQITYLTVPIQTVSNSTTNKGFNQEVFLWVMNNTCSLSGTYTFTASFQCNVGYTCSSQLLQPTTFTLSITTNSVCPTVAISPYSAVAYINLYDQNGQSSNTFQAADSSIVATGSVVISPVGGPAVTSVSVSTVMINTNTLPSNLYTVSNPSLVEPSVNIPMINVLLYASTSSPNTLTLVLFVNYAELGRKREISYLLQTGTSQRTSGNVNFNVTQFDIQDSGSSAVPYTPMIGLIFVILLKFFFLKN